MKTIVRFVFDNTNIYPPEYRKKKLIELIDPPVIPATGDPVGFKMDDFFYDSQIFHNYREIFDGQLCIAKRVSLNYAKDEININIVLYEEKAFKQLQM